MNEDRMKLYIAIRDEVVPKNMVPVLVAHTILNADNFFSQLDHFTSQSKYMTWKKKSFKKVVVALSESEWFDLIESRQLMFIGSESTVANSEPSCAIVLPEYLLENVYPILKSAKLWSTK